MDPLSQAVLGGIAAQTTTKPAQLKHAAIMGALAGMAADLDVFIRSASDPLLALEYHRHFTHSLPFVPIGALLCALVLHPLLGKRWHVSFKQSLLWCLLGYGTHALLDACTSYGTRLLWPFSNIRVAWDTISIIDPFFTLPLLCLLLLAAIKKAPTFNRAAIAWAALYLSLGFLQHERALTIGQSIAQSRGHTPLHISVKPSFANIAVWKVIYEAEGHFYIDAVKPRFSKPYIWHGDTVKKLTPATDLPWLSPNSQQAKDLARFTHFSDSFVALDPAVKNRVIDIQCCPIKLMHFGVLI